MLSVYDKPIIQYTVKEVAKSGIDDILIITCRNKRSIEVRFDESYELKYVLQKVDKDRILNEVRKINDLVDVCYSTKRILGSV